MIQFLFVGEFFAIKYSKVRQNTVNCIKLRQMYFFIIKSGISRHFSGGCVSLMNKKRSPLTLSADFFWVKGPV